MIRISKDITKDIKLISISMGRTMEAALMVITIMGTASHMATTPKPPTTTTARRARVSGEMTACELDAVCLLRTKPA